MSAVIEDFGRRCSAHRQGQQVNRALSLPLGVVVARDRIDHPWQTYSWRPISVFLNAPEISAWRELRRDGASVHYHAATLPLTLHPKETIGYVANLSGQRPLIYVVLREPAAGGPVAVALVTASPFEAEVYGQSGEETVGGVPMPARLAALLEAFVAEHHVEEPFLKRRRTEHHRDEDPAFGQEPIFGPSGLRARRPRGRGHG
jgi:hypothetical protein